METALLLLRGLAKQYLNEEQRAQLIEQVSQMENRFFQFLVALEEVRVDLGKVSRPLRRAQALARIHEFGGSEEMVQLYDEMVSKGVPEHHAFRMAAKL